MYQFLIIAYLFTLLTEELSLIRRLNPQHSISNPSQNHRIVTSDSAGQGCAHSGQPQPAAQVQHMQNNYSHSGRPWTDGTVQTGLCDYRHALQSSEFELQLLRDRQSALEIEHLKYRLAHVEQVNQQLNFTTSMLLHNQMNTMQLNNVTPVYGNHLLMPRQIPANIFGTPVQPNLHPTLLTQFNLQYMNPMVPVLPTMTAIPGTRSHLHGPPVHPMSHFNMVRPIQLQNTFSSNCTEPREHQRQSASQSQPIRWCCYRLSSTKCSGLYS